MEPVEDAGALPGQVVAAFGQQPQDGGLVLGRHDPQRRMVQGDLGHASRIGGVALAATAAAQQPRPASQGGRHVQDLLAGRGQLLGDGSSQPVGALNREPPGRPPGDPGQELAEGAGVDQQPAVAQRPAGRVDGDGGE
jgi:hypothetical protein